MKKHTKFISLLVLAFTCGCALAQKHSGQVSETRPNIIFIFSDDYTWQNGTLFGI